MKKVYTWFGGRKFFAGYVGVTIVSIGAYFFDDATFIVWGGMVLTSLGISTGTAAWEDGKKHQSEFYRDDAP